jgi:glycosyltransferase involved in cell wall biosynthesis
MFPQYLPNRLAYAYARANLWAAARRAERIFTVSETSKADILRYCDVAAERIIVVYNAIDARFATPPEPEAVERVRERYQLHGPFALYVGNIKPHKNLERLIDAFDLVRRGGFERLELLIIGDQISKYPRLRRAVDKHKLHKHVRFLGFVPDDTLAALYRLATVFVFPSLYEGFGLPPLEAMASGTPVVTSNRSSLPEVVGDAAVLVDPYSAASIADGIQQVLSDPELRRSLSARGLARAREFSWDASIRRVHEVYMDVASQSSSPL